MTFAELHASLEQSAPPAQLAPLLAALWWDAKGDWRRAHEIAQEIDSSAAAWVHAYLHRKEGDEGNAAYWYRQARRPHCRQSLPAEWEAMVRSFLESEG